MARRDSRPEQLQGGQALLEILLAFSVSVLVLSAVILGIITSLNSTQYSKNQGLANSYAQEGMAIIRQIRDSGWSDLLSYTTNTAYCLGPNSTSLIQAPSQSFPCKESNLLVGNIFSREIRFEHNSLDCSNGSINGSKILEKVSWNDNKCPVGSSYCHKVELITCFSNVDLKPTP